MRTRTSSLPDSNIHARKFVETIPVDDSIPRIIESAETSRAPADPEDSGQVETLPDGSISIPVFEEQVVVTKRTIVRERIIIRKEQLTENVPVRTTHQRDRVEIESDEPLQFKDGPDAGKRSAPPHAGGTKPLPGSP
jgi:uncharacterized protein (TIGR02271 family)